MRSLASAALAAIAMALALPSAPAMAQNWNAEVADTGQGYRIGDPEAPMQIIEFVSYTCPHCADFEQESQAELRYFYVHEGLAAVEVRHLIRNPIDMAAALLTECGEQDRFFEYHGAMLATQDNWLEAARAMTPAQLQRWQSGTLPSRMRAIAADLGFDDLMEGKGLSASQITACLNNEGRALEIAALSDANSAEFDVPGTPSFVLNGALLEGVHAWQPLREVLVAARANTE